MTIRTLVVEDDLMLAQILMRFVQRIDGFETVGAAHTCLDALATVEKLSPDLVLLDVYLDGNGIDILKEIRKRDLPCDVIMVTAAHDAATVTAGMRYGAVDYIVKPFEFNRLKAALANYASMHGNLTNGDFAGQAEIDTLKTRTNLYSEKQLPKNIDSLTLSKIKKVLLPEKSYTAGDIAVAAGISYGTVMRYLHFLLQKGELKKALRYPPRGRPVVEYTIAASNWSRP